MSTQYGDADLTPPQGFARPEDPDGFTVAPAVIGGDLPQPPPPPPHAAPTDGDRRYGDPDHAGEPRHGRPESEPPAKRSFLGKLLRRNGWPGASTRPAVPPPPGSSDWNRGDP